MKFLFLIQLAMGLPILVSAQVSDKAETPSEKPACSLPPPMNDVGSGYYEDLAAAAKAPLTVKHLNLQNARLTEVPDVVFGFSNLEILDVSNNGINKFPVRVSELKKLKALYLSGNQITEIPGSIEKSGNLEIFYLAQNPLLKISPGIGRLRKLKKLWLSSTDKNVVFEPAVWKLTGLESLRLMSMNVPTIPNDIRLMTGLRELCVSDNRLTEIPDAVADLFRLEYLSFGKNRISRVPEGLGRLHQLNYLGLYGNPISALPDDVSELQSLRWLAVWDTHIVSETQKKITDALPLARVAFTDSEVH